MSDEIEDKASQAEARTQETRGFIRRVKRNTRPVFRFLIAIGDFCAPKGVGTLVAELEMRTPTPACRGNTLWPLRSKQERPVPSAVTPRDRSLERAGAPGLAPALGLCLVKWCKMGTSV